MVGFFGIKVYSIKLPDTFRDELYLFMVTALSCYKSKDLQCLFSLRKMCLIILMPISSK